MFKKKLEDGFDTETNNILDLGKENNNNNNCLNEIEDKLGINFNQIIKDENKSSQEKENINQNNTKKFENPDDRPINPFSKNLKFDFDLNFEHQENNLINNNSDNNNINNEKEKKTHKNLKQIMSEKDLEELGKLPLKNNSSKINSNNSQEEIIIKQILFIL